MQNHVLVDLETLSTQHNAAIMSIGAVRFDNNKVHEVFYVNIDPLTCIQKGAVAEQRTMDWWKTQPESVQNALTVNPKSLDEAISMFEVWFRKVDNSYIWGNGPTFDCSILEDSFKLCNKRSPWPYNKERCVRTITQFDRNNSLAQERNPKHPKHHALYDALYEALHVVAIIKQLGVKLP